MKDLAIVTGGAGFIGSHLVERLASSGQPVRVVERPGVAVDHLHPAVDLAVADIRDRQALARALEGGRWVYHLAANPNLWVRDRSEFEAVNFQGTINVLEAALGTGVQRVLHTSTESILTKARAKGPIDEDVEIDGRDTVGPYCRSKLMAEEYAFMLARRGLPVVVANPTMPVGPGDRGLSPPTRLIRDFCRGDLLARMECTLNLIDVRDVSLGLELVMQRGQAGRRYLLGAENLTLTALLTRLSKLTGVPVPRWCVPYSIGLAVALVSEFCADYFTGRVPKATVTGIRLAKRIMHFDSSRSLGEIGLQPRRIDDSLADAITWLRQTGNLPPCTPPPSQHLACPGSNPAGP
jgi:dihydroflavonol-4-reductase